MAGNDPISRLAQQVGERLQDASRAPEEIQRTVQSAMRGAFERMELVTREDFDILMDVLQRTRSRVEALERQVGALEAALDERTGAAASPALVAADSVAPPGPESHGSTASTTRNGGATSTGGDSFDKSADGPSTKPADGSNKSADGSNKSGESSKKPFGDISGV